MDTKSRNYTVDLSDIASLGLVVAAPTAILYENQAGGHACNLPSLEGFYVPLRAPFLGQKAPRKFKDAITPDGHLDYQTALELIFAKYGGHCYSGIDKETADAIDDLLSIDAHPIGQLVRVDRDKLSKSMEAWVWVKGGEDCASLPGPVHSPRAYISIVGALTWANSD